jgi:hypothetical protein
LPTSVGVEFAEIRGIKQISKRKPLQKGYVGLPEKDATQIPSKTISKEYAECAIEKKLSSSLAAL